MGCYVDPPEGTTKEQWLRANAEHLRGAPTWPPPAGKLPIILIDNRAFTAAAVAYDKMELRDFTDPDDGRPRQYYICEIEKLKLVSPIEKYLKKKEETINA